MTTETTTNQLQVRRATTEDIAFLAWCNYEASSPAPNFCYWDPLLEGLNTDTMVFIQAVFRADALAWGSPEDFFIIEEDGKPIAGASGFTMDKQDYRPLKLECLPLIAGMLGWDAAMTTQFLHGYEGVWNNPLDETLAPSAPWIIECVAVVPEARGRGVAKFLMKSLLEEGKRRGLSYAGISVTMDNEPARRVYEAVGFQMYMAYGAEYFNGAFPGTTKYRMSLN